MINKKSSLGGIDANIVVLICYLGALLLAWFGDTKFLAWLVPLVIYIIERDNEFVKKHAAQASVLYFGYSMVSLIIMFMAISMFNITDIFSMNLDNFSGSLLMASTLSMFAMLVLVVVTILTAIVASKVWHYEDYDIPFVKLFVKSFRKFMDKLMNNNQNKKEENNTDEIIVDTEINEEESVSNEVKEDDKVSDEKKEEEVKLEHDTEVIDTKEIQEKKEVKQAPKKETTKKTSTKKSDK